MQQRVLIEGAPEVLGVEPELFDIHGGTDSSVRQDEGD
jgi:hypothetical protein